MTCYFGLYLIAGLSLLLKQPFGNPPDEYNRYLIPLYIAENGSLPNGYDEEIRIPGYGFSYAFQPILPYMLQGYAMKAVKLFTDSEEALLYTARGIDLALGLAMAVVVLLLAGKWFRDRRFAWCFAFLVTFLPQAVFVHTYVNTDSCCMLSIAVMLYGLTLGLEDGFAPRSSILLSVGIILCALSYYNAYGYILSCILLFIAYFITFYRHSLHFDAGKFLKKGIFISAIVLFGIAWWFLRSALLYDGDFLGLRSRNECAALYATPTFHPDTRITWQNQGYTLLEMLCDSDFLTLSVLSFIGVYGPMTIVTSLWVYRFYKGLFLTGILLCIFIPARASCTSDCSGRERTGRRGLRIFYHINMVFCIVMPFLLSLSYSYATDYQPQGRYLLPALLPLCFYTIRGLEKLCLLCEEKFSRKNAGRYFSFAITLGTILLCVFIVIMLLLTVYGYAFPYYEAHPVAP